MKKILTLCILSLMTLAGFSQTDKMIKSGWYFADSKTDSSLLVQSRKDTLLAYVYPTPILTIREFQKIKVGKGSFGAIVLDVTLTESGKIKFAEATKKWVGKKLAFVCDNKLQMLPVIISEIPGGKVTITGNFTKSEMDELKKKMEKEMKIK